MTSARGAPSIRTWVDSRSSPHPVQSTSTAMPIETRVSAEAQPQAQIATPAPSAPRDPAAAVARCTKEARMFRLWPRARWMTMALPALTSNPSAATKARPAPWTGTAQPGQTLVEDPPAGGEQQQGTDLGGHPLRAGEPEAVTGADRTGGQDQGA